ncbi:hypothetical protein [Alteromonas mediterranea]|uniref:hypothetical protein n=1 Tax=Alteromonas mediterranea TaxID=314275 RepID=UPI00040BA247|nr:hypothetical protein [Alteromonas mediterranea]
MLKTNYRISKNLKVVLAAFLLCAQFLLIVSDAFSFEQEHFISNEVCTESTLIELPNAYDLGTGNDCDHCCSCHGHFTHIAFYLDNDSTFLKKSPTLASVYLEASPSRFINQIERPPRI